MLTCMGDSHAAQALMMLSLGGRMADSRPQVPLHLLILAPLIIGFGSITCGSLAAAQSMNEPKQECAGIVATSDLAACFDKAYKSADAELNALYQRVQKVLHPDEVPSLVHAERLWVQYRDATCEAEYDLYGGGTGGPPTRLACLAAETRARKAGLLRSYGWRLEKFGG
jgi:uncharacterized protein YecT (DUF1311 family)